MKTGTPYRVTTPATDVRGMPDTSALRGKSETQLVMGETFLAQGPAKNGWLHGVCAHDGYAGHVLAEHLAAQDDVPAPTHVITAARSIVYTDASIKTPVRGTLSFGSLVTVVKEGEKFMQLADGHWIYRAHLAPAGSLAEDHVATALAFLETPYFWGGRSGFGIDCSGLVQVALGRAGLSVPRDTEQQIDAIGKKIDTTPRTGDLVFFPGHVGIMTDSENLLHANAFHMKTCTEPLWKVTERSGEITATCRLL